MPSFASFFPTFAFLATGGSTTRTAAARFAETVNVRDYGAVGDGVTDDTAALQAAFDAAFGTSGAPHGYGGFNNRPLYIPRGNYTTTSEILVSEVNGGFIRGDGPNTSRIVNNTSGGKVLRTNGFAYSRVEGVTFLCFAGGVGSVAFDLDSDGASPLTSNIFISCNFTGETGTRIGHSDFMGSENTFINCSWADCTDVGLVVRNFNALNNTIIGGAVGGCAVGIRIDAGSVSAIIDVAFGTNTGYDINIQNNAGMAITSCRTESTNFLNAPTGVIALTACAHAAASGKFIDNLGGTVTMSACEFPNTTVTGNSGLLIDLGNVYGATSLTGYLGSISATKQRDLRVSRSASLAIKRGASGTQYDNIGAAGAVTFTLPDLNDSDTEKTGTKFGFYVGAAQTLTVAATNNHKIRIAAELSAINGNISSNTVGNYVEIEAISVTEWVAKSTVGTWTVT